MEKPFQRAGIPSVNLFTGYQQFEEQPDQGSDINK
jgi:hypothetical protein